MRHLVPHHARQGVVPDARPVERTPKHETLFSQVDSLVTGGGEAFKVFNGLPEGRRRTLCVNDDNGLGTLGKKSQPRINDLIALAARSPPGRRGTGGRLVGATFPRDSCDGEYEQKR